MLKTTLCYLSYEGQVLMLHRVKKHEDVNAGKWIGIGGKIEEGETPEQCMLREFKEETGLCLTQWSFRGIVNFKSEGWEEQMYLYTASAFTGTLTDCDEGELCWMEKSRILDLSLWEGDRVFLSLLEQNVPFSRLDLIYQGENLLSAVLDGVSLDLGQSPAVSAHV